MTTNAKLRQLMQEHGLKNREIAELIGLPVDPKRYQSATVSSWVSGARNMPGPMLKLLLIQMKNRPATPQ